MSIETPRHDSAETERELPLEATETAAQPVSFWTGRSELLVPALVLVLAIFLSWQTATMNVLGSSVPGPQFFPTIVCILLYGVAVVHIIQIFRAPQHRAAKTAQAAEYKTYTDWKTVGMVIGGVAGFILLLPVLGWILSAAALFWIVARALGSKRALFDVSLSLLFSSAIQLAFNAGLGLNLPSGLLEGLL